MNITRCGEPETEYNINRSQMKSKFPRLFGMPIVVRLYNKISLCIIHSNMYKLEEDFEFQIFFLFIFWSLLLIVVLFYSNIIFEMKLWCIAL